MIVRIGFLLALILAGPAVLRGDVLEMYDGERIEGQFIGGSQHAIRFEHEGRIRVYLTEKVRAIHFGEAPLRNSDPEEVGDATSVIIPAGSFVTLRLQTEVGTDRSRSGDEFRAVLASSLQTSSGFLIAPAGAAVSGRLVQVQSGTAFQSARLRMELRTLEVGGREFPIYSGAFRLSDNNNTLGNVVVGAIIGGLLAEETLEGMARGAAVGLGVSLITEGEEIRLPRGTMLDFQLSRSVRVQVP